MSSSATRKRLQQLSPEQVRTYRDQFEMFDLNGDGVISARELRKVSRKLGYRLTEQQLEEIMEANDLDCNGCLTFDEFLLAMPANDRNISRDEHRMADIRRKFMEYDKDGNGVVTIEEAHDILRKELAFTSKQSAELVKRYDKNHDGKLSYEEFIEFYSKVRRQADEIKQMFHEFDKDGSGAISVDEAKSMLRQVGIPDTEVETLVAMYDTNNDGELQYDEFVSFLVNT